MDAIAPETPEVRRLRCQIHALKRAEQRGIMLTVAGVIRLEREVESLRRCWQVRGAACARQWITVRHGRQRFKLLYDGALRCIVTVYPARRLG